MQLALELHKQVLNKLVVEKVLVLLLLVEVVPVVYYKEFYP